MPKVNSSMISEVEYDEQTEVLSVTFAKGGSIFNYYSVPKKTYDDMIRSKSIGRFFHANIKNNFNAEKSE